MFNFYNKIIAIIIIILFTTRINLSAQFNNNDAITIIQNSIVYDGALNYYVRDINSCTNNCTYSPYPGINVGPPDFSTIKNIVGADLGFMNITSGLQTLQYQSNSIESGSFLNGKIVRCKSDLLSSDFKILFMTQPRISPNWQLGGDLNNLVDWYNTGLRVFNIAWFEANENHGVDEKLGYATDANDNLGISQLGINAISLMNNLGILVDVAHCNSQTTIDAANMSSKPILASHTGVKAINNISRNKSDSEIIAIANTGGIIGITPICWILEYPTVDCDVVDLADHIVYVKNLVGIDHVSIASDANMDGWESTSVHIPDPAISGYMWYSTLILVVSA